MASSTLFGRPVLLRAAWILLLCSGPLVLLGTGLAYGKCVNTPPILWGICETTDLNDKLDDGNIVVHIDVALWPRAPGSGTCLYADVPVATCAVTDGACLYNVLTHSRLWPCAIDATEMYRCPERSPTPPAGPIANASCGDHVLVMAASAVWTLVVWMCTMTDSKIRNLVCYGVYPYDATAVEDEEEDPTDHAYSRTDTAAAPVSAHPPVTEALSLEEEEG